MCSSVFVCLSALYKISHQSITVEIWHDLCYAIVQMTSAFLELSVCIFLLVGSIGTRAFVIAASVSAVASICFGGGLFYYNLRYSSTTATTTPKFDGIIFDFII